MGANNQGAILSLVDRHLKYTKLHILNGKTKAEVTAAIITVLRRSKCYLKTITYDSGKEFAGHRDVVNVENILNHRPREMLNFHTPHEVFTNATMTGALHH